MSNPLVSSDQIRRQDDVDTVLRADSQVAGQVTGQSEKHDKFEVHLAEFAGPFDVLLSMIAKRKLDVTHISLSIITDEFVQYVSKMQQDDTQLDEISHFILIAATLLEIKAARLIPGQENLEVDDLEALEARDLLFAKLLQYKAFKNVGVLFGEQIEGVSNRFARNVPLDKRFAKVLPELKFETDPRALALLAAGVVSAYNYRNSGVSLSHIHMRQVNVAQQGIKIAKQLKLKGEMTFSELVKDAKHPVIIIGRFLSLLELYKMSAVTFTQKKALSELVVKWVAPEDFDAERKMQGLDEYN